MGNSQIRATPTQCSTNADCSNGLQCSPSKTCVSSDFLTCNANGNCSGTPPPNCNFDGLYAPTIGDQDATLAKFATSLQNILNQYVSPNLKKVNVTIGNCVSGLQLLDLCGTADEPNILGGLFQAKIRCLENSACHFTFGKPRQFQGLQRTEADNALAAQYLYFVLPLQLSGTLWLDVTNFVVPPAPPVPQFVNQAIDFSLCMIMPIQMTLQCQSSTGPTIVNGIKLGNIVTPSNVSSIQARNPGFSNFLSDAKQFAGIDIMNILSTKYLTFLNGPQFLQAINSLIQVGLMSYALPFVTGACYKIPTNVFVSQGPDCNSSGCGSNCWPSEFAGTSSQYSHLTNWSPSFTNSVPLESQADYLTKVSNCLNGNLSNPSLLEYCKNAALDCNNSSGQPMNNPQSTAFPGGSAAPVLPQPEVANRCAYFTSASGNSNFVTYDFGTEYLGGPQEACQPVEYPGVGNTSDGNTQLQLDHRFFPKGTPYNYNYYQRLLPKTVCLGGRGSNSTVAGACVKGKDKTKVATTAGTLGTKGKTKVATTAGTLNQGSTCFDVKYQTKTTASNPYNSGTVANPSLCLALCAGDPQCVGVNYTGALPECNTGSGSSTCSCNLYNDANSFNKVAYDSTEQTSHYTKLQALPCATNADCIDPTNPICCSDSKCHQCCQDSDCSAGTFCWNSQCVTPPPINYGTPYYLVYQGNTFIVPLGIHNVGSQLGGADSSANATQWILNSQNQIIDVQSGLPIGFNQNTLQVQLVAPNDPTAVGWHWEPYGGGQIVNDYAPWPGAFMTLTTLNRIFLNDAPPGQFNFQFVTTNTASANRRKIK